MIGPLEHIPILPLPFLKKRGELLDSDNFSDGITLFTLGMNGKDLKLWYTETDEVLLTWTGSDI